MKIFHLLNKISSNKFYQILQKQSHKIIPQVPQNHVLSKYLQLKQIQKNNKYTLKYQSFQKYSQPKLNYLELLNGNPYGSIQYFIHKNVQFTLISTNYFKIDQKKFHKVLYTAQPDTIVIQRRPDYHIHNFNLLPKGPDGIFSDKQYLNQLKVSASDLQPIQTSARPIINVLNKYQTDQLEQKPQKQILHQKGFQLCKKYSASYTTPIYLAQMPMRSYRQWLANTHTLMQLQQLFKVVCRRLPRYKNIPFTPYQLSTLLAPDPLLKISDIYMSTIIQMLISTHQYKKILGIFGITQNQSIKYFLQHNKSLTPIIQHLIPPKPQGSIIRNIQNLQIIQKHLLLDVMFQGKDIVNIKTNLFHITNTVIQKYGKDIDKKNMMNFRYDKIMEYLKLMDTKYQEGEEQIKKQFVRETLRNPT